MLPWQLWLLTLLGILGFLAYKVFGFGTETEEWEKAFGSAPCFQTRRLIFFRIGIAVLITVHLPWSLVAHWDGGRWPIYLAHWSLLVEAAFSLLLIWGTDVAAHEVAHKVYELVPADDGPFHPPLLHRIIMALFVIQMPLTFASAVLFWTVEHPAAQLCLITREEPCLPMPRWLDIFEHGGDSLLCVVSFFTCRIPYNLQNAGWFLAVMLAYVVMSYVHYLTGVGTGRPCGGGWESRRHFEGPCPIYPVLDWNHPRETLEVLYPALLIASPAGLVTLSIQFQIRKCVDWCLPCNSVVYRYDLHAMEREHFVIDDVDVLDAD